MIIDRYLVQEVVRTFFVTGFLLLAIFTAFSLSVFLVDADAGSLRIAEVTQLTALKALIALEVLLPLSFYLAVMIGLGRLYSDSEIYAMRACGISELRLLKPVMALALALALLIGGFSVLVRPWAYAQSYKARALAAASTEIGRIKPSRFYVFDDEDRTIYVERISEDGKDLQGIFIRSREDNNLQVITSATGKFSYLARPAFHQLKLLDAQVFKMVADGPDFFARLGTFSIWMPAQNLKPQEPNPESTQTANLQNSVLPDYRAEFQWRLSTPVSTLLLALLAIPLSRSRPRQGRYTRMLFALVIYAVYFSLLDISRSWVQQNLVDNIWWVPGLLGAVVLGLYLPWKRMQSRGDHHHA
ncbi:MAG: LPS export ABC transporter permease LptF [Gammaproteobacteria bacterium]|nr:MAG: LPS export ABC transporter permease LptF [Gammaproteobacteria bacterium]